MSIASPGRTRAALYSNVTSPHGRLAFLVLPAAEETPAHDKPIASSKTTPIRIQFIWQSSGSAWIVWT
ncbi:MAG: hypothetical protein LBV34_25145 [Nocardiopsaceae bacterium]|jgi:hypothetical protein|nr:hypothetical protein [Nocardiopsaceae bacterium]